MLKIVWFFSWTFLGTAWSMSPIEEVNSPEIVSLPTLEVIESILRSSFGNASRTNGLGGLRHITYDEGMYTQEGASYMHHGIHKANAGATKLECVWEAMTNAAMQMQQTHHLGRSLSKNLEIEEGHIRGLCSSLAASNCGADFNQFPCNISDVYRSIDGSCNNLQNTRWGSAPQPFERYLPADYGPMDIHGDAGFRRSRRGTELPEPRAISRVLSSSTQRNTPKVTLLLMQWGQFIDHDVTLTPERELHEPVNGSAAIMCCDEGLYSNSVREGTDCRPIDVNRDPYYEQDGRQCIRFVRSMPAATVCSFSPMEQINQDTAFVDASQVYGSEMEAADYVRLKRRGLLKITDHPGNGAPLPPMAGVNHSISCPLPESMNTCFFAGDVRVDEMPGLTAMHTAFIRLHNLIARGLVNINKSWRNDDELVFQETRRIVSAIVQQITYRDWLPKVVGSTLMKQLDLDTGTTGYKDTYNKDINPTIRNVFATAAFRFGHTLLTDFVKGATAADDLDLAGHFFNTTVIKRDGTSPSSILKGLSRCPAEPIDGFVANTFTDKLFAEEPSEHDGNFYGLDLVSLNIQRGRDHGIPSYRKWRKFCGLRDVKNFPRLRKVMERELAIELQKVYGHINDLDLFPAGLSEFPLKDGGILGPTFSCILARQFAQIKHGDRFWHERENQPKPFTPRQLSAIRTQSLSTVLCAVSQHTQFGFQPNPFLVSDSPGNNVMPCSNYPFIDLSPWKH